MFKKSDIILIVTIFLICVSLAVLMFTKGGANKIRVTVNGTEYATYNIYKEGEHTIKTENGTNVLVIENGAAYFKESDCPDKTCENIGKIKNLGESIVCLPHRVIAEVVK